jgi:hypothetical protein
MNALIQAGFCRLLPYHLATAPSFYRPNQKQKHRPVTLAVGQNSLEAECDFYSFSIPSPDRTYRQHGQHPRVAWLIWK